MSNQKRTFFDLFEKDGIRYQTKYGYPEDELPTTITVENKLRVRSENKGLQFVEQNCTNSTLVDFVKFYQDYDGFDFGIPVKPKSCMKVPLLHQFPALELQTMTSQYLPGGELAWTIDNNKSKSLYRESHNWIVFARIGKGPSCLSIFLSGINAGNIYLIAPQPQFNILKPISKSYNLLLGRIAKDPAAFFRLIRAHFVLTKDDGQNYGYKPVAYFDN